MQKGTIRWLKTRFLREAAVVLCTAVVCTLAACNGGFATESAPPTASPPAAAGTGSAPITRAEAPESSATPRQSGLTIDPGKEPPLDADALSIAVPDFLTAEQQDLYRRAYCMYMHMFAGETASINDFETADGNLPSIQDSETVEMEGNRYTVAQGRYRNWSDFDAVIHALFTEHYWSVQNTTNGGAGFFRDYNGLLCYLDVSKGGGYYYNENFPDEFRLDKQTDERIEFTLIGHYSPVWSRDGETGGQRDERRASEYDYTIAFPMKIVRTEDGWRFSEFHSALAEERESGNQ